MRDGNSELSRDPRSSRKARGLRLKSIRQSLNLSRHAFAEKLGVSVFAVQNWEINKNKGLSEDRIFQVVNVLKQMGAHCTVEWLSNGLGPGPTIVDPTFADLVVGQALPAENEEEEELILIAKELKLFRDHYPGAAIDMQVQDDGMEPQYVQGEYVAGLIHTGDQIKKLFNSECIVQIETGEILLRLLKQGSFEEHYTLMCFNANTKLIRPILYDVKLLMAAPVIWARKPRQRVYQNPEPKK